uniref:Uncharacterized protein n=1 Tax=Opuntia streptacantha TaxID=393608 RepID=A0A7C9DGX6_OPUST
MQVLTFLKPKCELRCCNCKFANRAVILVPYCCLRIGFLLYCGQLFISLYSGWDLYLLISVHMSLVCRQSQRWLICWYCHSVTSVDLDSFHASRKSKSNC